MLKIQSKQEVSIFTTMEELVPKESVYRAIDKYIDFEFIYEKAKELYSNKGAMSVDPVNIFKIELINILEGFNSIRKTCRNVNVNAEFRWFLNIPFGEKTPHFSTLSQVYKRKFEETEIYEEIFFEIIKQVIANNLLDTRNIYIDGTHIKACANKKKFEKIEVIKPENAFIDEIFEEINKSREKDGMKLLNKPGVETKIIKKSTVDPDCGYYVKGEKEKQMAYVSQVICDENGYALDAEVVPGNVHDSQSCKEILTRCLEKHEINHVAADAGYKTGPIANLVHSHNALFFTAYTRPRTKDGFFKKYDYVLDEGYNQILCPNDKILEYKRTNKQGYKIYESCKKDCKSCEFKSICTTQESKQVFLSVFHDILEEVEHNRHTDKGKEIYKKRKEKIERLFADWKEKYGMRYLRLRGKTRVRNHILFSLACMNMKKMSLHLRRLNEN